MNCFLVFSPHPLTTHPQFPRNEFRGPLSAPPGFAVVKKSTYYHFRPRPPSRGGTEGGLWTPQESTHLRVESHPLEMRAHLRVDRAILCIFACVDLHYPSTRGGTRRIIQKIRIILLIYVTMISILSRGEADPPTHSPQTRYIDI